MISPVFLHTIISAEYVSVKGSVTVVLSVEGSVTQVVRLGFVILSITVHDSVTVSVVILTLSDRLLVSFALHPVSKINIVRTTLNSNDIFIFYLLYQHTDDYGKHFLKLIPKECNI